MALPPALLVLLGTFPLPKDGQVSATVAQQVVFRPALQLMCANSVSMASIAKWVLLRVSSVPQVELMKT